MLEWGKDDRVFKSPVFVGEKDRVRAEEKQHSTVLQNRRNMSLSTPLSLAGIPVTGLQGPCRGRKRQAVPTLTF